MYTQEQIERAAKRLAALEGRDWANISLFERDEYIDTTAEVAHELDRGI